MGVMGIWQWIIILAIVLLLFGRGKIPGLLGDLGNGIRAFKKGVSEDPSQNAISQDSIDDEKKHA